MIRRRQRAAFQRFLSHQNPRVRLYAEEVARADVLARQDRQREREAEREAERESEEARDQSLFDEFGESEEFDDDYLWLSAVNEAQERAILQSASRQSEMTAESRIIINGVVLSMAQTKTARMAIELFVARLQQGLGDDEHGRAMARIHRATIDGIRAIMFEKAPDADVFPNDDE
jgi:hypothetical protein